MSMRARRAWLRVLALGAVPALLAPLGPLGCGKRVGSKAPQVPDAQNLSRREAKDRPPLVAIPREGDPRGALAVAVLTAGIDASSGSAPSVALAALVEHRLRHPAMSSPVVETSHDGFRVKFLVASPREAKAAARALREALLRPVNGEELELPRKRLDALRRRPLSNEALDEFVSCTGEVFGPLPQTMPLPQGPTPGAPLSLEQLETWRQRAHGLGRIALATVGPDPLADDAFAGLSVDGPWPVATAAFEPSEPSEKVPAFRAFDAPTLTSPGQATAFVTVFGAHPPSAVRAAQALGSPQGPLSQRLHGLEGAPQLKEISAAVHAEGACLALRLEWSSRSLTTHAEERMAAALAVVRQEVAFALGDESARSPTAGPAPFAAEDPRDAAERAAWWSFSNRPSARTSAESLRVRAALALGFGKDVPEGVRLRRLKETQVAAERSLMAEGKRVVENRVRLERAQGELWVLLGSPCGTLVEGETDSGAGYLVAGTAAQLAMEGSEADGVKAEPWVSPEGIGIVVHGLPLPGESADAHAKRLGHRAARAFLGGAPPAAALWRNQAQFVSARGELDPTGALGVLSQARSPGHPSWVVPWGKGDALGRMPLGALLARSAELRQGPLRAAVLANGDAAQGAAVAEAADRWVASRSTDARRCAPVAFAPVPHPGTYSARGTSGSAEAWLVFPLKSGSESERELATLLAEALDGPDGWLSRVLTEAGLAREFSSRVLGRTALPSLAIHLVTPPGALDTAVAQTRGLLDRLRHGALSESDRTRAVARAQDHEVIAALDPHERLAALFRGDAPSAFADRTLAELQSFASATLKEDSLIVVAAQAHDAP